MSSAPQADRALVSEVVGREIVCRVAPLLARVGIAVMPLKGVWLQACVYRGRGLRTITDVDLLVQEHCYERALDAMTQAGWRRRSSDTRETSLAHAELELPVDLHRRLFTPGAFRLPTAELFARARADSATFGVALQAPDPLDVYAHMLGHSVKSRLRLDEPAAFVDFRAMAEAWVLDPRVCAHHLERAGMARAARFAFGELAEAPGQGFLRALLESLRPDPRGERVVALARVIARRAEGAPRLGALPGFLVERSLTAGALVLARRFADRARGG